MAISSGSLSFVVDVNTGRLPSLLRASRAARYEHIVTFADLGIPADTLDEKVLAELGRMGQFALITRDGRILDPILQRGAWRQSGVTLFLMGKWGQLRLGRVLN